MKDQGGLAGIDMVKHTSKPPPAGSEHFRKCLRAELARAKMFMNEVLHVIQDREWSIERACVHVCHWMDA